MFSTAPLGLQPHRVETLVVDISRVLVGLILVSVGLARDHWAPPLDQPLEISGPFRAPPTPYAAGHRGIDLPAFGGETVYAPTDGTVSFIGTVADRGVISIQVDPRTVVSFEPVESLQESLHEPLQEPLQEPLAEGSEVARNQPIGVVGEGGHCEAECLHIGVRVDGEYVNPLPYFASKPVLLPWE